MHSSSIRTTTVLAADAANYSRAMSLDERRASAALTASRAVIDAAIAANGGGSGRDSFAFVSGRRRFDAAEGASGERAERSFPGAARPDRRQGPPVGEAGRGHRLAVSRGSVRCGLFGQGRTSAAADAAHGGFGDPQVHARPRTRTSARAGWRT